MRGLWATALGDVPMMLMTGLRSADGQYGPSWKAVWQHGPARVPGNDGDLRRTRLAHDVGPRLATWGS